MKINPAAELKKRRLHLLNPGDIFCKDTRYYMKLISYSWDQCPIVDLENGVVYRLPIKDNVMALDKGHIKITAQEDVKVAF